MKATRLMARRGRPPLPPEKRRRRLGFRVPGEVFAWLEVQAELQGIRPEKLAEMILVREMEGR